MSLFNVWFYTVEYTVENYYSPIYDVVKLQNKAIRVINDVPIKDTLGARDVSSAVSGFCQVFIVTRAKSLWSRALLL